MNVDMYFDGSCNPANGYGSMRAGVVFVKDDEVIWKGSRFMGHGDNNLSEFRALLYGLQEVVKQGYKGVNCFGDNQLVINGMRGRTVIRRVKYLETYFMIEELVYELDWASFYYIKRNTGHHLIADQLSKRH